MPDPIAAAPSETVTPTAATATTVLDIPTEPSASVAQSATPVAEVSTIVEPTVTTTPEGGAWGDDWRAKYAGDDKKVLARLERYTSPKAAIDALFEAQKKISAGEFAKALPANATPEQVTEWRVANGVPEKPDGYFEKLPDGLVLGEEDRAVMGSFAEAMHAKNVKPEVMHDVVRWYNDFQQQTLEDRAAVDAASLQTTQAALQEEWGADFRANLNMVHAHLDAAPKGLKDRLIGARSADGTPLINDPAVMNYLASMAREINPAATLVSGTGNTAAGVNDEIAAIEKKMATDRKAYMKDEPLQARYRDLLDARERLARKAG